MLLLFHLARSFCLHFLEMVRRFGLRFAVADEGSKSLSHSYVVHPHLSPLSYYRHYVPDFGDESFRLSPQVKESCCQASQVHAWQSAISTVNIARNNKYKVCLILSLSLNTGYIELLAELNNIMHVILS